MLQRPVSFLLRRFLLESEICPLERGSCGITRKQCVYVYEKPTWVCIGAPPLLLFLAWGGPLFLSAWKSVVIRGRCHTAE